jgi:hypothetical protein
VDRAIRIADTLIRGLELRGFVVEITAPETSKPTRAWERPSLIRSKTRVLINAEYVEFTIEEAHDTVRVDITKDPYYGTARFKWRPDREHRFNRRLMFRIGNAPSGRGVQHNWSDGKVQRIETQLNSIARGLVVAADALRAERLERERWHREFEEEQRRREELRLRRDREARRVADLNTRLAAWRESREIQEFVALVERDARDRHGEFATDTTLGRWIAWLRRRADELETNAIRTIAESDASLD